MLQKIDKEKFEVFCFSIQDKTSWWRTNISSTVEHFFQFRNFNIRDSAEYIAGLKIEVLIDLNGEPSLNIVHQYSQELDYQLYAVILTSILHFLGHTLFTGLPIMSYRPAPLQLSFLGLPTTTSASFIDYYIGDFIALPPEHRSHFSEHLVLMQPCYISNDYALLQGDVANLPLNERAPREMLKTKEDIASK